MALIEDGMLPKPEQTTSLGVKFSCTAAVDFLFVALQHPRLWSEWQLLNLAAILPHPASFFWVRPWLGLKMAWQEGPHTGNEGEMPHSCVCAWTLQAPAFVSS